MGAAKTGRFRHDKQEGARARRVGGGQCSSHLPLAIPESVHGLQLRPVVDGGQCCGRIVQGRGTRTKVANKGGNG